MERLRHNWVINKPEKVLGLMARVYEPKADVLWKCGQLNPDFNLSGNFLMARKGNMDGFINLEMDSVWNQHFPDSLINRVSISGFTSRQVYKM
jgi:hypothetical protein